MYPNEINTFIVTAKAGSHFLAFRSSRQTIVFYCHPTRVWILAVFKLRVIPYLCAKHGVVEWTARHGYELLAVSIKDLT